MSEIFPKGDLSALLRLEGPLRTLALLAALRFVAEEDLIAIGARAEDIEGFEADDAVLRLPLQRTITTARPVTVCALRHGGAAQLAAALGAPLSSVPRETRSSCRRSVAFMDHAVATSRLALALGAGLAPGVPARLVEWVTDSRELTTGVTVASGAAREQVTLVPDALARTGGPRGPESLVIEIDRGTERPSYMARKYGAYRAWWLSREHVRAFGPAAVRILTVAPDERRRDRLRSACREATSGRTPGLFWFASDAELAAKGANAPLWSTPAADRLALWEPSVEETKSNV